MHRSAREKEEMNTLEFLTALFGHPSLKDLWIPIWTNPMKKTHWFPATPEGLEHAAQDAFDRSKVADVYVGCCPQKANLGPNQRGTYENVAALVAMWADIDVASPAHKAGNLPPDKSAAMDILGYCPIKPSIVIDSGYGIQAWWLSDPWVFESEEDRSEAANLSARWNACLQQSGIRTGNWQVDTVKDLTRVLRIPGTLNRKLGTTKPVRVIG